MKTNCKAINMNMIERMRAMMIIVSHLNAPLVHGFHHRFFRDRIGYLRFLPISGSVGSKRLWGWAAREYNIRSY